MTVPTPDLATIHAEMERARGEFHALIAKSSQADLARLSNGTRWTNRELLFHMLLGYLVTRKRHTPCEDREQTANPRPARVRGPGWWTSRDSGASMESARLRVIPGSRWRAATACRRVGNGGGTRVGVPAVAGLVGRPVSSRVGGAGEHCGGASGNFPGRCGCAARGRAVPGE